MFRLPDWTRIWLIGLLKFAAYVAVLWAAFRFIFDFSSKQAIGLGLAISIATDFVASRKRPVSNVFRPHMFEIHPRIGRMLIDIGLASDEEVKTVSEQVPPYWPWSDKHLFHYPIRAFVISYDPDTKVEVIHYPELGYYSTRLDVESRIQQFTQAEPGHRRPHFEWAPEFFVKLSRDGYSFGIRVSEHWWKENKAKVAAGVVLLEDHEYNFGRVRLTLAILPYAVASEFYIPWGLVQRERLKEILAKYRWTEESRGGGELPYFGETYKHEYVEVWTSDLDPV